MVNHNSRGRHGRSRSFHLRPRRARWFALAVLSMMSAVVAAPSAAADPLSDASDLLEAIQVQVLGVGSIASNEPVEDNNTSAASNTSSVDGDGSATDVLADPVADASTSSASVETAAQDAAAQSAGSAEAEVLTLLRGALPEDEYECYRPYVFTPSGSRALTPFDVCYGLRHQGCDVMIGALFVSCLYGVIE